jgi:hypothetical protein
MMISLPSEKTTLAIRLGRVDGFDQDECTGERDEGAVILRRLLAA